MPSSKQPSGYEDKGTSEGKKSMSLVAKGHGEDYKCKTGRRIKEERPRGKYLVEGPQSQEMGSRHSHGEEWRAENCWV